VSPHTLHLDISNIFNRFVSLDVAVLFLESRLWVTHVDASTTCSGEGGLLTTLEMVVLDVANSWISLSRAAHGLGRCIRDCTLVVVDKEWSDSRLHFRMRDVTASLS
jgi:hypothetical protein